MEETLVPAKKEHPDAPFVAEVVERLAPFGAVSARAMFGGYGLFVDGVMFGLVDAGTLYLKADEENRPAFEAAGLQPWVYQAKTRPMTMSYYPLPEEDLGDREALSAWFEGARAAAIRAASVRKRRPKR